MLTERLAAIEQRTCHSIFLCDIREMLEKAVNVLLSSHNGGIESCA